MVKQNKNSFASKFPGFIAILIMLFIWGLVSDPQKTIWAILLIVAFYYFIKFVKIKMKEIHLDKLINSLRNNNEEEYLKNFLNRFGLENGKNRGGYTFRNHNFDLDRINDLIKILKEKDIISNDKDVYLLINHYIQTSEENLTRESILKEPQKFSSLSGSEFEKLIYRLFIAKGYNVELIGKSGDQGGDLIANKNGERILIQAKCYRDWSTGNDAVQQVVGAMKIYDCNKAQVITTSYFTPEAIVLAKANTTELISKEQLQNLLMDNLKESWS